jgi:hypothetical protein
VVHGCALAAEVEGAVVGGDGGGDDVTVLEVVGMAAGRDLAWSCVDAPRQAGGGSWERESSGTRVSDIVASEQQC